MNDEPRNLFYMISYILLRSRLPIMNFGGTVRVNPLGIILIIGVSGMVLLYIYANKSVRPNETLGEVSKFTDEKIRISLKELLSAAIHAAQMGGKEVKTVKEEASMHQTSKGKTKEGANVPVTDGDRRSHNKMFYGLKMPFPPLKIISEEHDSTDTVPPTVVSTMLKNSEVDSLVPEDVLVPAEEVVVWIDPLDATQEYTESLLQYVTTMVCVAVRGTPVIGVIHKPFEDLTAWGWVGKGVGPDIKIGKERREGETQRIIVSRSHAGKVEKVVKEAFGNSSEVIPAGGAGYKTLEVIKGTANAYIHVTQIKKWDICAGNAILNTLKGQMTTLDGKDILYSAESSPVNKEGLLATLYNHKKYQEKLKVIQS